MGSTWNPQRRHPQQSERKKRETARVSKPQQLFMKGATLQEDMASFAHDMTYDIYLFICTFLGSVCIWNQTTCEKECARKHTS